MNLYTAAAVANIFDQTFAYIMVKADNHVLTITLNRAEKKNALHPKMVDEIAYALQYAHFDKSIWMIVFAAKGQIFCAGGDLKAMAGFIEPNNSTIPKPDNPILIGELFNKVHKPMIAKVTGDVYAGGFFFLAGSTIVLAQADVKFGLPEVKRGIFPFQVMAALMRVMPARKVIDWCIRGYNLPVEAALQYGLVTEVVPAEAIDAAVEKIIEELRENSPTAIQYGLEAYDALQPSAAQHQYLHEMLLKTIQSNNGREGLKAFREKRKPNWE